MVLVDIFVCVVYICSQQSTSQQLFRDMSRDKTPFAETLGQNVLCQHAQSRARAIACFVVPLPWSVNMAQQLQRLGLST